MAVEIAQAYVSITPSARGIGRSLGRELNAPLAAAGAAAGDSASRSFASRFTPALARIGKTAAVALGVGIGTAGFFGIKTAANFEQTRVAFEGILGDVEKANKLLGDLRDFAAKTPFEFTGLTKSAQNLLAVGFASEDIIPVMSTLGDVAATLGVGTNEIEGVVRALGQMKGKGKASAEELQQISEQIPGFSAINAIAQEMGISTAEAFDQMAKGAIPADVAIQAILEGMENFPGAAGGMERQSKTLNGVISTFKDTLATTAIDFITPYLPAISRAVAGFGGFIQDMADGLKNLLSSEGFRDFKTTVSGVIVDGLEAIKSWWDRNNEAILGFFTTFADVAGSALGAIGDWIWQTVLPALGDFVDWLSENKPVIVGVLAAIAAGFTAWALAAAAAAIATIIANLPIILILAAIAAVAAVLYYAYTNWGWFREGVDLAIVAVVIMIGVIQTLVEWVGILLDGLRDVIDAFGDLGRVASGPLGLLSPGGGNTAGGIGDFLDQQKKKSGWRFPMFDDGGIMPGPLGVHSLAWVAGGETLLATHKAPAPMGGSVIGELHVTQLPGEDAAQVAFREARRHSMLVGA